MSDQYLFPARYWIVVFCSILLLGKTVWLLESSNALGWDAYYYLMQVQSIVEPGPMQAIDYSLIYPWLLLFDSLFASDTVAYHWAVASICVLVALGSFRLLSFYTHTYAAWFCLAALLLFSPTLSFMAVQFPKNLLGLAFLLLLHDSLLRRNWVSSVLLLVLCFFGHRLSAGLGLLLFLSHLLLQGMRLPRWILLGSLGLIIAGSLALPGIFHISDLRRFRGTFQWEFQPLAFPDIWPGQPMSLWWSSEVWGYYLVAVVILGFTLKRLLYKWDPKVGPDWRFVLILLLLVVPIWTFYPGSMGYRLFLSFLILAIPATAILLEKLPKQILWGLTVFFMLGAALSWQFYHPQQYDAPFKYYEQLTSRMNELPELEGAELIIAHKGLAEMIIYRTRYNALNWLPDYPIDPRRVWRVTTMLTVQDLQKYLAPDERSFVPLQQRHMLIREDEWQLFYQRAQEAQDRVILSRIKTGMNPLETRPFFLRKGHLDHD